MLATVEASSEQKAAARRAGAVTLADRQTVAEADAWQRRKQAWAFAEPLPQVEQPPKQARSSRLRLSISGSRRSPQAGEPNEAGDGLRAHADEQHQAA